VALALAPAVARAEHPPDPFASQYVVPPDRDFGTAAGQLRAIGSGLVAFGPAGPEVGLQGTLELMTLAYVGVRSTLEWTALRPSGQPMVLAGKIGPSLHLVPYRVVDVSLFFEGGVAGIDLTSEAGPTTAAPILSPGATLQVWLASWAFLQAEGHVDWAVYTQPQPASDAARGYLRFVTTGGLGLAI
jgi:hypothetical protein